MQLITTHKKMTDVIRCTTDKWGDPLQCHHHIGDGAFSFKQINCTSQASL